MTKEEKIIKLETIIKENYFKETHYFYQELMRLINELRG